MMPNNWDPFDLLVELKLRLDRLEQAHNKMAEAYYKTDQNLEQALEALQQLQLYVLRLQNRIKVLSEEQSRINKIVDSSSSTA